MIGKLTALFILAAAVSANASEMKPTPEGCAEMLVADIILVPYSTVGLRDLDQLHAMVSIARRACHGLDAHTAAKVVAETVRELCGDAWPCVRPDLR